MKLQKHTFRVKPRILFNKIMCTKFIITITLYLYNIYLYLISYELLKFNKYFKYLTSTVLCHLGAILEFLQTLLALILSCMEYLYVILW